MLSELNSTSSPANLEHLTPSDLFLSSCNIPMASAAVLSKEGCPTSTAPLPSLATLLTPERGSHTVSPVPVPLPPSSPPMTGPSLVNLPSAPSFCPDSTACIPSDLSITGSVIPTFSAVNPDTLHELGYSTALVLDSPLSLSLSDSSASCGTIPILSNILFIEGRGGLSPSPPPVSDSDIILPPVPFPRVGIGTSSSSSTLLPPSTGRASCEVSLRPPSFAFDSSLSLTGLVSPLVFPLAQGSPITSTPVSALCPEEWPTLVPVPSRSPASVQNRPSPLISSGISWSKLGTTSSPVTCIGMLAESSLTSLPLHYFPASEEFFLMKRNTRSGTVTPLSSNSSVYRHRGGAGSPIRPKRSTLVPPISIPRPQRSTVITPSTTYPCPSNIVSLPIAQINHQCLAVADSTLPGAGKGLFTLSPVDTEEVLCKYSGIHISPSLLPLPNLHPRFDYVWANKDNSIIIDAYDLNSCYGRYANDALYEHLCNAVIEERDDGVYLVSTRPLLENEEIFVHYGEGYWADRFHLFSSSSLARSEF